MRAEDELRLAAAYPCNSSPARYHREGESFPIYGRASAGSSLSTKS